MRLSLAPVLALLVVPLLPIPQAAATVSVAPARVTAVVQDAHGRLSFRSERAANPAAARARAARWRLEPSVVAADADHPVQLTGDPLEADQWGLAALRATDIWAAGDATGQVIAVVDTGVDATHPDLAGVVRAGTDFVAPGDGRIDPQGHGTHVAGIAAAVAGNGLGGAGLAKGAQVLPVRVMGADGSGTDSDAAKGIVWAADNGATVVNLSLGGPDRSSVMDAAVKYVLGKGIPIIASSGNAGFEGDPVMWPAANAGVIAVGAVDIAGAKPGWSSTGSHLAVVAPGARILSTVPGGGYASYSGTSMAAPFVTAAAALLRRSDATLKAGGVRDRLISTAADLGPVGFDSGYGYGRIDVARALGLADPVVAPVAAPVAAPVVAPAPAPVAPAVVEPVVAAPAPVAEPAPVTVSEPVPAQSTPVAAPVTAPVADAIGTALPVLDPTLNPALDPALVAAEPAPVAAPIPSARISASRISTPYAGAVTFSTRSLLDGQVAPGVPVRLERRVGTSWLLTRTGTTGADGLASWLVRPDRTADFRVVGSDFASPLLRITVTPVVRATARLGGITGRVLPAAVTAVRLQQRRSTGWVTLATSYSRSDGTFTVAKRLAAGSVVRAVALGVPSAPVRVS